MPKKMFNWLAQQYIFYTSKSIQKTNILFAIFDDVEVAWYIYDENSSEFNIAEMKDVDNNNYDPTYSTFAGKISFGASFVPKNVDRVSEFANGFINVAPGKTEALARFSLRRIGGDHIHICINLYLKTGPQLIEFASFKSENSMDLPANHEWGQVSLLKTEKFSSRVRLGSYLSDPSLIRSLGTMRPRLFHPKPHAK